MLLSFEIPTRHIEEFTPLEDLQFGLAHLFLKPDFPGAEEYVKLYQGCLLDNSMYELGAPLATDALVKAADDAQAIAVIAPDYMDEMEKTLAGMHDLLTARPKTVRWTVGGVVQGKDYHERKYCYIEMMNNHLSPICFPFRSPREETVPWLFRDNRLREQQWYHLLGLRNLKELTWNPPGMWSIDTAKPFKGFKLNEVPNIRGQGSITTHLHDYLSLTSRRIACWNIAYMRHITHDHERTQLSVLLTSRRKHGK